MPRQSKKTQKTQEPEQPEEETKPTILEDEDGLMPTNDEKSKKSEESSEDEESGDESSSYEGGDESSSDSEGDEDDLPARFKENVVKYIKYDDLIRKKKEEVNKINKEIRTLKVQQSDCDTSVKEYMVKNKFDKIDTGKGILKLQTTQKKGGIKADIVKNAVLETAINNKLFKNEKTLKLMVDDVMKCVESKLPVKEDVKLVRRKKGETEKPKPENKKKK